jgi:hypothetical protein
VTRDAGRSPRLAVSGALLQQPGLERIEPGAKRFQMKVDESVSVGRDGQGALAAGYLCFLDSASQALRKRLDLTNRIASIGSTKLSTVVTTSSIPSSL